VVKGSIPDWLNGTLVYNGEHLLLDPKGLLAKQCLFAECHTM
jgi:hypothetical protein